MEFMEYVFWIALLVVGVVTLIQRLKPRKRLHYDNRGFDHNHIHKNGTKYDDEGFDYYGYNAEGYNHAGYNRVGRNAKGQYNRLFDTKSGEEEGFYTPSLYPIALTNHAAERFAERLGIYDSNKMKQYALDAYRYGKSKRQIKKTSAYFVEEIEAKDENSIVLIYNGYIYVFTRENVLKTFFKNERIPL